MTIWASKCSMALLFTRLTPRHDQKKLALGLRITVTVWLVLSIFLVALRCNLSQPWIFFDPKCTDAVRLSNSFLPSRKRMVCHLLIFLDRPLGHYRCNRHRY